MHYQVPFKVATSSDIIVCICICYCQSALYGLSNWPKNDHVFSTIHL